MINFILKRLFHGILILVGVVTITFVLFQSIGDPLDLMLGHRSDVSTKESLIRQYGFDKPIHEQYLLYVNDISPFSFHHDSSKNREKYNYLFSISFGQNVFVLKPPFLRRSFRTNQFVTEVIKERAVGTFWLTFSAMTFATIVGILLGILAALNYSTWIDKLLVSGSVLGISAPSYVAATIITYFVAIKWNDWTHLSAYGYLWEVDSFNGERLELKNLILPAFTLGIRPLAVIMQLTRSSMIDVLGQEYIKTAIAKGLSQPQIIWKHALRNALNPVISAISGWIGSLMAGTIFIEMVFSWQGLGNELLQAVLALDMPVVMGITIYVAMILVVINLIVDIIYGIVDPRIRLTNG